MSDRATSDRATSAPATAEPAGAPHPVDVPTRVPLPRPRWLGRALVEAAIIACSVLLGFAVNEWGQSRERDRRADQALAAIALELDSNRVLVRRARLRQRAKADTLARYAATGEALPGRVYLYGMFDPARVQSTAWEAAREGDVLRELPYALVLRLGRLYERQTQYRTLSDQLVAGMYEQMRREGVQDAFGRNPAAWELLNRDFADRAGTLEELYAATVADLRDRRRAR